MSKHPIYLDNAATTPLDPRVLESMMSFLKEEFGNAGSNTHVYGEVAKKAVENAKEQITELINCDLKDLVITSGATEGVNLAIKGVFEANTGKGNHIITVCTEHKAVLDTCEYLETIGADVTYLPVDRDGMLDLSELKSAIKDSTILISVMYANNEIGVIQEIPKIGAIAHEHGILMMTDATQAVGKIRVDVGTDNIDLMTFSAHKMYGPKGIGALYVKNGVKLTPQIHGGGHQAGMRSGTLNVAGIVGFGVACELSNAHLEDEAIRLSKLRNTLEARLLTTGRVSINGHLDKRLPHISNLCFSGLDAEDLVIQIRNEIAISTGSACTSEVIEPSHVIAMLGKDSRHLNSNIRFSFGRFSTEDIPEKVCSALLKMAEYG